MVFTVIKDNHAVLSHMYDKFIAIFMSEFTWDGGNAMKQALIQF